MLWEPLQSLKSTMGRESALLTRTLAEEKLFVRKATGLVREIGAITAIIIVMANTIGLGWQKRVFQFTGKAPLPENQFLAGIPPMTMAFILGGIAILLSVLAVSVLAAAMPRSGGGYVVISRIIGPVWGFLGSWLEFPASHGRSESSRLLCLRASTK